MSHAREPSYHDVPEWRIRSANANLAHSSDTFAKIKFPSDCFYYSFLSYLLNFSSEQGTFGRNKYLRKFTPVRSQSNPNETLGKLLGGALTELKGPQYLFLLSLNPVSEISRWIARGEFEISGLNSSKKKNNNNWKRLHLFVLKAQTEWDRQIFRVKHRLRQRSYNICVYFLVNHVSEISMWIAIGEFEAFALKFLICKDWDVRL